MLNFFRKDKNKENENDKEKEKEKGPTQDSQMANKRSAMILLKQDVEKTDVSKDPIRGHTEVKNQEPPQQENQTFREPIFANSLIKSLITYKKLFRFFVRFPFNVVKDKSHYIFVFKWKSFVTIGFLFTSALVLIQLLFFLLNVILLLLHVPILGDIKYNLHKPYVYSNYSYKNSSSYPMSGEELRASELYVFHRNLVPVLIIMTSLINSNLSNICILARRRFLCDYYSFWTDAVELMRIDAAYGVKRTISVICVLFFFFMSLLLIYGFIRFAPITTGSMTISALMTYRICYTDGLFLVQYFWILAIFHGVFIIYVFINSKCIILLFLWTCRLLIILFKKWNVRLDSVLHNRAEASKPREQKVANRTGFDHLFKDHVCLLDLMEGADTLFGQIVEAYYTTTIASICFEIFYLVRSQSSLDEFVGGRKYDGVVMLTYFLQTILILFMVTWSAASISDEALEGLDIVRRKGMMGKKEKEELYFMLSMYVSYSGHFDTALSCGGYFVIDKGFLVGLFGTIVSYFIVVIQFLPPLIMKNEVYLDAIKDLKSLIEVTEWTDNPYQEGQTYPVRTDGGSSTPIGAGLQFYAVPSNGHINNQDKWDFEHDFEFLQFLNATNNFTTNSHFNF